MSNTLSNFTLVKMAAKQLNIAMLLCSSIMLSACGGSSATETEPTDSNQPPVIIPPAESPIATSLLIEAEDYVRVFDTTEGNEGNAFRNDNVDIEAITDGGDGDSDGSGFIVSYTEAT